MLRPTAQKVSVEDNGFLLITFDNGERKRLDCRPYIKGKWYGKLADPAYFKQAEADGFTIVWPEGQDLCPDEIYNNAISVQCLSSSR